MVYSFRGFWSTCWDSPRFGRFFFFFFDKERNVTVVVQTWIVRYSEDLRIYRMFHASFIFLSGGQLHEICWCPIHAYCYPIEATLAANTSYVCWPDTVVRLPLFLYWWTSPLNAEGGRRVVEERWIQWGLVLYPGHYSRCVTTKKGSSQPSSCRYLPLIRIRVYNMSSSCAEHQTPQHPNTEPPENTSDSRHNRNPGRTLSSHRSKVLCLYLEMAVNCY